MTFDDLKDAIPGETVFDMGSGVERVFIALDLDSTKSLVVRNPRKELETWTEDEISPWTIKQPKRKLYAFVSDTGSGRVHFFKGDPPDLYNKFTRVPEFDLEFES